MERFVECFNKQEKFQKKLLDDGRYKFLLSDEEVSNIPCDSSKLSSYHIQQLVSEIGEVLESDKRWKSHRSETTQEMLLHKREELADCFIVLINLCMFSNISADEILSQIESKIETNFNRIKS